MLKTYFTDSYLNLKNLCTNILLVLKVNFDFFYSKSTSIKQHVEGNAFQTLRKATQTTKNLYFEA